MTIISNNIHAKQAYVWIWLPGKISPIVAGRIQKETNLFSFTYGKSYLENPEAIALSPFELPLREVVFLPQGMNIIHSCLRDAAPDAWGRRVMEYKYGINLNEIDYLLLSSHERIGGLDFQKDFKEYRTTVEKTPSLEDLLEVTSIIEQGLSLPPELEYALLRGTSVGGARPKALIQNDGKYFIAKFSLSTDTFNIIKAEYIGMRLAKELEIDVPSVSLKKASDKDILMVQRFDREYSKQGFTRRLMLSGLSLLRLNELEARYASYLDFADVIRQHSRQPIIDLKQVYMRLIFNVLIGNTDDHARNHSAFWDGKALELTPAYDLCPQSRVGQEATQAMAIEGKQGNFSTLSNVLSVCEHFQIDSIGARMLMESMIESLKRKWPLICDEAELSFSERERLWGKAVFNPFIFQQF